MRESWRKRTGAKLTMKVGEEGAHAQTRKERFEEKKEGNETGGDGMGESRVMKAEG